MTYKGTHLTAQIEDARANIRSDGGDAGDARAEVPRSDQQTDLRSSV